MEHKGEKHVFVNEVVEPTCTTSGYSLHTCIRCGYSYKDKYLPAAHKFRSLEAAYIHPDCTKPGRQVLECRRCGRKENIDLPPLGHAWDSWVVDILPTCLQPGLATRKCTCLSCKETESRPIPATGHYLTRPRKSGEKKGITDYFCTNCGETVTVKSFFRQHTLGVIAAIAAIVLALLAAIILPIIF